MKKFALPFLLFLAALPLTSNAAKQLPQLEKDEGLAIIAIYSKGYAEKIKLDGPGFGNDQSYGPLLNAQHFEVQKLKAGKYKWEKVIEKVGESLRRTSDLSNLNLGFEIVPGKLNYIGLLMFESNGSTYSAKVLNRTSIILSIMKQDFPHYLKNYSVVNGIYPDDQYIEYFLNNSQKTTTGE
ncbi:MAG: hypothetical protein OQK09_07345 [Colwellia sp.]|nr:hypothetical protein [Colwellia sp.]MCW9081313.1 hypothetical protein [Colwellia sp.]